MDLNELLHAHQLEVMKAGATDDTSARQGHFARIALYAERIRQLRGLHAKPDATTPRVAQPAIIYGTYAGNAPSPAAHKLDSWENEGGALHSADPPLPPDITMTLVRQYRIGPYVYQDRALAMAEYQRRS
ncbi:hypothetical protein [Sphingopyxis alaskensis]|uniref:hypothetical protein n=1 Tax=Sphingopyxis alaskensis TaxID=117207 RepID=UPI00391919B4